MGYLGNQITTVFPSSISVDSATISGNASVGGTLGVTGATTLSNTLGVTGVSTLSENIVFDASGKGVHLGVTSATASNLIDDFEEGTWTPTFRGNGGTAGSYTYAEQQGHYVKVGNLVTVWINLTNIATSSGGNGGARINGLPFAANWQSGFNGEQCGNISVTGFTGITTANQVCLIGDGYDYILLYHTGGTNADLNTIAAADQASNSADISISTTQQVRCTALPSTPPGSS